MSKKQTGRLDGEMARRRIEAPEIPYAPRDPKHYRPKIGLIGCGGITQTHLRAYRQAGYNVVALCDVVAAQAEKRRQEFYPSATVHTDYRELLRREDIAVVDVATHPGVRAPMIQAAIRAGKHVLSQKPFVLDLDTGERLVELADRCGVKLAVNQNARWAPHFSYLRQAVARGVIGQVMGAHLSVHWNHDHLTGTAFDRVHHVLLYDFAIHWFDIVQCFLGDRRAKRVYASLAAAPGQKSKPPLLAQALIEYDQAQASLVFDAFTQYGPLDLTCLVGTKGTLSSVGPDFMRQKVTLYSARGQGAPRLRGGWVPDGFHGTMAELLCAIEEKREPRNSARQNLHSLALCFAAVASAERGRPMVPGRVRRLPEHA